MVKEIPLTQGKVMLVSDHRYDEMNTHSWYAWQTDGYWYAARFSKQKDGPRHIIFAHRVVVGAKSGEQVDHIDGNGLNNQDENLRICSISQNEANSNKREGATSKYKGVTWNSSTGKWKAQIQQQRHLVYLGVFEEEEAAAKAYDAAARIIFGDYAKTNFGELEEFAPPKQLDRTKWLRISTDVRIKQSSEGDSLEVMFGENLSKANIVVVERAKERAKK